MTTMTEPLGPGTRRLEALQRRHAGYAMHFVNDAPGMMPTDAKLAEVLAVSVVAPRPEDYPAIRQYVHTYLDGRESAGRNVRGTLLDRAESYASDARKFGDMAKLGTYPGTIAEAEGFATMYRTVADELRTVAASLETREGRQDG